MERREPDFSDRNQVDESVALEGSCALDLLDELPRVLRCPRRAAAQCMENAHRQPSVLGNLAQSGVALPPNPDARGIVDGRQPDAVEILERSHDRLGLLLARDLGKPLERELDHGEAAIEPSRYSTVWIPQHIGLELGGNFLLPFLSDQRDAHGLEPGRITEGVVVDGLYECGSVGGDRIELRQGEVRLIAHELSLAPTAQ